MLRIYAVYDVKAKAYAQPFFMKETGQAIRGFKQVVNDPQTEIYKNPEDFSLFQLGEYDEETGGISPLTSPVSLAHALQMRDHTPEAISQGLQAAKVV